MYFVYGINLFNLLFIYIPGGVEFLLVHVFEATGPVGYGKFYSIQ